MARIAGINIPSNQHLEIGLTSIFGVGRSRAREICKALNIPCSKKVKDLNEKQTATLIEGIANNYVVYAGWLE